MRRFRPKRMQQVVRLARQTGATRILDVGGTAFDWNVVPQRLNVTLLNRTVDGDCQGFPLVLGDACDLPFADGAFDVVYSNSTIEHLFTWHNQQRMASEIMRVGRAYFVQTPNRWFPVEPHYLTPFIHWLPKPWQRKLLRNFTVWGLLSNPAQETCDRDVDEIRLLSVAEMRVLFPTARIVRERFLGLTKSILAIGPTCEPLGMPDAAAVGPPISSHVQSETQTGAPGSRFAS
jgi:hypothetical protein